VCVRALVMLKEANIMQSGTGTFNDVATNTETIVPLRVLYKLGSRAKREAVTDVYVLCSRKQWEKVCCYKMCLRMNTRSCV
jgi:hypothetical protein